MSVECKTGNSPQSPPEDERKVLVFCPSLVRHGVWGDQGQRQGFRFGRYIKRDRKWLVEGSPGVSTISAWWDLPGQEPVVPKRPRGLKQITREIEKEQKPRAWIRKLVNAKTKGAP